MPEPGRPFRIVGECSDGETTQPIGPSTQTPSRAALLAGEGLTPEERADYQQRIAHDCCDCGCDMTVAECLASDQKCPRSPDLARQRQQMVERGP